MKHRLWIPSAILLAVHSGLAAGRSDIEQGGRDIVLAQAGQPVVAIVAPTNAPASVRFAADELKEHLDLMTGGAFEIVQTVPTDGRAIVLGDTPGARRAGIAVDTIGRDGYAIRTVGNTIYIAGRDDRTPKSEILFEVKHHPLPATASRYDGERALGMAAWDFERGTLYGAYRFLEELGVRWFFAGDKGRAVPQKPDLAVAELSLTEEPAYILRQVGMAVWQWYRYSSPAARSTINIEEYENLDWGGSMVRLWFLRIRGSSEWFAFNHRPVRLELEERFGAEHPEYFALRPNGARDLKPQTGRTGHLCYTHPSNVVVAVDDIVAYRAGKTGKQMGFSDHRIALNADNRGWSKHAIYGRSASLLPHDSFRGCQCPRCKPRIRLDKSQAHWHSELIWPWVAQVGGEVEKVLPDELLICLAYSTYSYPPDGLTRLPDNVVVGLCPGYHARTSNNVDADAYGKLMDLVETWSGMNEQPMMFWFHHLYRSRQPSHDGVPMLLTAFWQRFFRDLAGHGNMMFMQLDSDSVMLEHLNRYIMYRLLYNPHEDVQAIVVDYAHSFYGPGADIVLELLEDIEAKSVAIATSHASMTDIWDNNFTDEVMAGYRRRANELMRVTTGTPHAEAAQLFSAYFVGNMERGHQRYVRDVRDVLAAQGASADIRSQQGPIQVDGVLDEAAWSRSEKLTGFHGNVDGKRIQWPTEVRMLWSPESLHIAFTCHDPNTPALPRTKGDCDWVEIFLDPNQDHQTYYQVLIDSEGRIQDWYYEGGGEPRDATWDSGAEVAVKRYADRWIVEVRLPRMHLQNGMEQAVDRPWGANFCRTIWQPPQPNDRFSTWSPLLLGRFAQPDLFGHIQFTE